MVQTRDHGFPSSLVPKHKCSDVTAMTGKLSLGGLRKTIRNKVAEPKPALTKSVVGNGSSFAVSTMPEVRISNPTNPLFSSAFSPRSTVSKGSYTPSFAPSLDDVKTGMLESSSTMVILGTFSSVRTSSRTGGVQESSTAV